MLDIGQLQFSIYHGIALESERELPWPKFTHISWDNIHPMTTRNERNLVVGYNRRWEYSSETDICIPMADMLTYGRNMFHNIYSIVKLYSFNEYSKTVILQLIFKAT